jgi:hypothetical protein
MLILYSQKYWWELNFSGWSQITFEKILTNFKFVNIYFQEEEEETCGSQGNRPPSSAPRFENPYDTMFVENSVGAAAVTSSRHHQPSQPPPQYSETGVYSDPGEVTGEIPS